MNLMTYTRARYQAPGRMPQVRPVARDAVSVMMRRGGKVMLGDYLISVGNIIVNFRVISSNWNTYVAAIICSVQLNLFEAEFQSACFCRASRLFVRTTQVFAASHCASGSDGLLTAQAQGPRIAVPSVIYEF